MKRMKLEQFLELCEEYYDLVRYCNCNEKEAIQNIKDYLKRTKVYGFSDWLKRFGIKTHNQLYRYGGQLADEIEAF